MMIILLTFTLLNSPAYTGYRRSIGDVLEGGNDALNRSKEVEVEHHNNNNSSISSNISALKSTATILTHNTTAPTALEKTPPQVISPSEAFIQNEQQPAPQPAPRTRLSSQNSFPMTNGSGSGSVKSDDPAQVRFEIASLLCFRMLIFFFFFF
jgi:hypothetical protein